MLVDKPGTPEAAVKGTFVFQRKSQRGDWSNTETIPPSTLKKDEGYRLEIKSTELLTLFDRPVELYQLHAQSGVPRGKVEFIRVNENLAELTQMPPDDLRRILAADRAVGSNLLARLLAWATASDEPAALVTDDPPPGKAIQMTGHGALESISPASEDSVPGRLAQGRRRAII